MTNDQAARLNERSSSTDGDESGGGGTLQRTLGMASTAASLVLYPYVAAGKVAIEATSYAVQAPRKITEHVTASLTNSWQGQQHEEQQLKDKIIIDDEDEQETSDLFGERAVERLQQRDREQHDGKVHTAFMSPVDTATDLFGEKETSTEYQEDGLEAGDEIQEAVVNVILQESTDDILDTIEMVEETTTNEGGAVSHLLFLPVRLVSNGVSTAVSVPKNVLSYSGKKISGAVSTSHSLASSALMASTGAVARTSLHVAQGLTHGAFTTASFTASTLSSAVGKSVRTARYVIPPSVSNAVWQGMGATSNASVNLLSFAIAVPAYRMMHMLIPEVTKYITEHQCVEYTRDTVHLLIKVLGPQNAFYVLKFMYETVNSDEVHDLFLLCQDIVRETLDGDNYRKAGKSVCDNTGITTLVPVVKEAYNILPSFAEILDIVFLVTDVSTEVVGSVVSEAMRSKQECVSTDRFEYLDTSSDGEANDSESSHSTLSADDYERSDNVSDTDGTTVNSAVVVEEAFGEPCITSGSSSDPNGIFEKGLSFFTSVCDSEEATSFFNTVGDFLDVLVDTK